MALQAVMDAGYVETPDAAAAEAAGGAGRLDAGSVLILDGLVDDELREALLAEITAEGCGGRGALALNGARAALSALPPSLAAAGLSRDNATPRPEPPQVGPLQRGAAGGQVGARDHRHDGRGRDAQLGPQRGVPDAAPGGAPRRKHAAIYVHTAYQSFDM